MPTVTVYVAPQRLLLSQKERSQPVAALRNDQSTLLSGDLLSGMGVRQCTTVVLELGCSCGTSLSTDTRRTLALVVHADPFFCSADF